MFNIEDVMVRKLKQGDEIFMLEFIKEEYWDTDMYEIRAYKNIDQECYHVAVDKTDTPIGFIGICLNAPSLYYICNFIVRKDVRNRGIGRKLWKVMLEKAGDTNMCLDAVSQQVDWYIANGFSIPTIKYYPYEVKLTDEMKTVGNDKLTMVPLSEESWPSLMEYDRHVYPNFDREKILRTWFTDEVVEVAVAMKNRAVCGCCCIIHRQACNEYTLKNGFADDEDVLEEMLRKMLKGLPTGSKLRFSLLEGKPVPKYFKSINGSSIKFLQRMYSKEVIDINTHRMWLGADLII